MAERPDGPNSGWGSESFCLSVHLSCLVTSLYLSASVCLILLVCLPSASQRVYLFSYLVFLSIFYRGIHSSFNQFCFIYLSVHLHISAPIHPSIQLFIFCIRLFHLPYLPSRKDIYIYIFIYLSIKKNHVFSHLSPCLSLSLSLSRDVETYNVLWKSDPSAMQQAPFCTSRLEPNVTWSQSHEEVSLTAEMHLRLNFPLFEWLSRKWPSEPTVRGARPVSHIGRAKRKLMRTLERKAPWIRIACRKTRDLC